MGTLSTSVVDRADKASAISTSSYHSCYLPPARLELLELYLEGIMARADHLVYRKIVTGVVTHSQVDGRLETSSLDCLTTSATGCPSSHSGPPIISPYPPLEFDL